jgi:hypothetical protein
MESPDYGDTEFLDIPMVALDTRISLHSLRSYLGFAESQIAASFRAEEAKIRARRSQCDFDENDAEAEWQWAVEHYDKTMKPILRYSFVVLVHITFETRLREICDYIVATHNLPVRASELQGSAVEQVKRFFGKLVGIEIGSWDEWRSLKEGQNVRNCIVHSNGVLDDEARRNLQVLTQPSSGITEDEEGRLAVSKDYCEIYLAKTEAFFHRLFVELQWEKNR